MLASPLSTRDRRLRGSICSRNCPCFTRSPSFTARLVTRPIVSALMFTERFGWIVPDAETIASSRCFLIGSTLIVTAFDRLNARLATTIATSAITMTAPMMIFFRETFMNPPKPTSRPR